MHPDVQSLLAVQVDDMHIYALERQLAALAPRLDALEKERAQVENRLTQSNALIASDESRHREALQKVDVHKGLVERSQRQYEGVTSPREATAAMTQLEQTKRMSDDSLRDATSILQQIGQHRHRTAELEAALAEVEERQRATRAELAAERESIEKELADARAKREESARVVPRPVLAKYDRVRSRKRSETVFPLRGFSCSACDTAIPTQRRASMASTGALEMCEGCGVLLYAGE